MILPPLPDLRAQLAAVINTSQHGPHGYNDVHASSSASPHDHNIDPAIGGPGGMMSTGAESGGDDSLNDGRKGGKRELSQSKRAAQNRAAQVRSVCLRLLISARACQPDHELCLEVGDILVKLFLMVSLLCQFSCHPRGPQAYVTSHPTACLPTEKGRVYQEARGAG